MPTAIAQPGNTLLNPTNHTLIMIDHQSQMSFATKSIDPVQLRNNVCLLYTSPSPRDATLSRMPSSA